MKEVIFNIIMIVVVIFGFILSCNKKENIIQRETIIIEIPKTDTIYIDTLPIISYINQDSIDRAELIRDSIQFRKITKKINGGYNGFEDRYAIWLRARNVLKNKNK